MNKTTTSLQKHFGTIILFVLVLLLSVFVFKQHKAIVQLRAECDASSKSIKIMMKDISTLKGMVSSQNDRIGMLQYGAPE